MAHPWPSRRRRLRIPHGPMARSSPTRSGGADSISSPASSSSEEEEPPAPAMAMAAAEEKVMREERTMVSHLRRPRRVSVPTLLRARGLGRNRRSQVKTKLTSGDGTAEQQCLAGSNL